MHIHIYVYIYNFSCRAMEFFLGGPHNISLNAVKGRGILIILSAFFVHQARTFSFPSEDKGNAIVGICIVTQKGQEI